MMFGRRRLFSHEVVQSSSIDCGPAALKSMLEGFSISVGYEDIRDACDTGSDGTSLDLIQAVAEVHGLAAEQEMAPPVDLVERLTHGRPAIVALATPDGFAHFVVVWRYLGPVFDGFEIMDPAQGRSWVSRRWLTANLYGHAQTLAHDQWSQIAAQTGFIATIERRLDRLGLARELKRWRSRATIEDHAALARLDAAARALEFMVDEGQMRRSETGPALTLLLDREATIPSSFWSVVEADDAQSVIWRGAVALIVSPDRSRSSAPSSSTSNREDPRSSRSATPPSLTTDILGHLRAAGARSLAVLASALVLGATIPALEALMLRGLLDVDSLLGPSWQRAFGIFALVALLCIGAAFDVACWSGVRRLGRQLEVRLRVAFLEKIPRLSDRYMHSRPKADMADRSHNVYRVRNLPELLGNLLRTGSQLVLTVLGALWIYPPAAVFLVPATIFALAIPLLLKPLLDQTDLEARTHAGATSRFFLDALLGGATVRAYAGARRSLRREHEARMLQWARSQRSFLRQSIGVELIVTVLTYGLAFAACVQMLQHDTARGGSLLFVFWALATPELSKGLVQGLRMLSAYRTSLVRITEPLHAATEFDAEAEPTVQGPTTEVPPYRGAATTQVAARGGVRINLEHTTVRVGSHALLRDINLELDAGEHVAIVGTSGAGKSTLMGVLLGWHRQWEGQVRIDGADLDPHALQRLRERTVWIDPEVRLWNDSLLHNLLYGAPTSASPGAILHEAELQGLVSRLPHGLETNVGEEGRRLSGGEGQRVRLGRGFLRHNPDLVLLDEPFRGLAHDQRHTLLARARSRWASSTMLFATHDIAETLDFPRVLVVQDGAIVEDGDPSRLRLQPASRYATMLAAHNEAAKALWDDDHWRSVLVAEGRVHA